MVVNPWSSPPLGARSGSASPAPALPAALFWARKAAESQVLPYRADRSDAMDVALADGFAGLGTEAASALTVKRIGLGKYEIDKRTVSLSWGPTGLLVHEDHCDSTEKPVPLLQYLYQALNVALALKGSEGNRNRDVRVTFDMDTTPSETDRREAMRIACKQAGIRTNFRVSQKNGHLSPRKVRIKLRKSDDT